MNKNYNIALPDNPQNDDILIFEDGQWKCVKVDYLYRDLVKQIDELKGSIADFKVGVNNKIKDLYEVLQVLTKGE